jgi:2-polyprenyl-6-methoxyphenol hydroxylase-like FAD-dependent oxidoreductase
MLLARAGHRVLLIDRADFPSDTVSTHLVHVPAVARLKKWGLWDRIAESTPPIRTATFDLGPLRITSGFGEYEGNSDASGVRRHILDNVLLEGARESGVEVRTRTSFDGVIDEGGRVVGIRGRGSDGLPFEARAAVVIGADGKFSRVARAVGAREYNERGTIAAGYYSYFRNLPQDGITVYPRGSRVIGVQQTSEDQTLVFVQVPQEEVGEFRKDVEANFLAGIALVPEVAERVARAERVEAIHGAINCINLFREASGPGWVLIGDAGYVKDPTLGHGIMDAFIQAEELAEGLDRAFRGEASVDAVLAEFSAWRDPRFLPFYELITHMAAMAPPSEEELQLFAVAAQDATVAQSFFEVIGGVTSPEAFFVPENMARMLGASEPVPLAA